MIPIFQNEARKNLTGNARELWIAGIENFNQQKVNLLTIKNKLGYKEDDQINVSINNAIESNDKFIQWLEEESKTKTGPSGIGKENYTWYQQNVHLLPMTWEDEVRLLQRELDRSWSSLMLEEHNNRNLPELEAANTPEEFKVLSIDFAEKGGVTNVGILSEGINYQVNDTVVFDDSIESSFKATAKVSRISGPDISEVSYSSLTRSNIEFYPAGKGLFVGIASTSLELKNNTLVNVGGLSTTDANLKGSYNIGISSDKLELTQDISAPISTDDDFISFFPVRGNLRSVRENDVFKVGIGTEQIKVLNVDAVSYTHLTLPTKRIV